MYVLYIIYFYILHHSLKNFHLNAQKEINVLIKSYSFIILVFIRLITALYKTICIRKISEI